MKLYFVGYSDYERIIVKDYERDLYFSKEYAEENSVYYTLSDAKNAASKQILEEIYEAKCLIEELEKELEFYSRFEGKEGDGNL